MAGELTFFELGGEDPERGRAFYGALFGWEFAPGPSGEGYTISTPTIPGGIHGNDPQAAPYVFFRVDDVDAAVEQVRRLGGTAEDVDLDADADSVAQYGRFKLCRDDQGCPFGLHQPPPGR